MAGCVNGVLHVCVWLGVLMEYCRCVSGWVCQWSIESVCLAGCVNGVLYVCGWLGVLMWYCVCLAGWLGVLMECCTCACQGMLIEYCVCLDWYVN